MSIVAMQKVQLVALAEDQAEIIKLLQESEIIEITDSSSGDNKLTTAASVETQLAEIKSAVDFLTSLESVKKSFIESFLPAKEEIGEAELMAACHGFECQATLKKCEDIEDHLNNLKNLKTQIQGEKDRLIPFEKLNVPINLIAPSLKTVIILGKIKTKQLAGFSEQLAKLSPASDIQAVSQAKEETYLVIAYLAKDKTKSQDFLSQSAFEAIALPESVRTPKQELAHLKNVLKKTETDLAETMKSAKELGRQLNKLKYMYDLLLEEKQQSDIRQKFGATSRTFIIEGWIKKADLTKTKNQLTKATSAFLLLEIEPNENEKPPVALTNPKALAPFEVITQLYGSPSYNEFDPSILLSFFFIFFFGLCLGDFVYGLVLTVFSLYLMKRYKLPVGGQKLFTLLAVGGLVAAVVGVLTGSYLGFTPAELPATALLSSLQIIDPVKDPLTMLAFSLALGVVQILFGLFIHLALLVKSKNYVSAILDDGLWIFWLSSLVFLAVASALSSPLAGLAGKLSLFGGIALFLTQGRSEPTLLKKGISGLLSLYKVSGYLGDTLSYSRLLALGMSTTIIGAVINILANMVKGTPGIGVALMVLILIIGHLFNLILGVLGAFIHSVRLQLVEFFGKFYEGGGQQFRPFKRMAEYTVLK